MSVGIEVEVTTGTRRSEKIVSGRIYGFDTKVVVHIARSVFASIDMHMT